MSITPVTSEVGETIEFSLYYFQSKLCPVGISRRLKDDQKKKKMLFRKKPFKTFDHIQH